MVAPGSFFLFLVLAWNHTREDQDYAYRFKSPAKVEGKVSLVMLVFVVGYDSQDAVAQDHDQPLGTCTSVSRCDGLEGEGESRQETADSSEKDPYAMATFCDVVCLGNLDNFSIRLQEAKDHSQAMEILLFDENVGHLGRCNKYCPESES